MSKEIDIEYYHQLALQKQKEHRKVLAILKKKPPKKPISHIKIIIGYAKPLPKNEKIPCNSV